MRLALALLVSLAGSACGEASGWRDDPPRLIAHGGGAVGALHVTNSLQALDRSASEEFLLIEVDLSWTSDGHLVLLHDWEGAFEAMFGLEPGPRSLELFLGLTATDDLQQLGLDELAGWMALHPQVGIVTDIKTERLRGLEVLAERLAVVRDQVVPQVHDVEEGRRARELGFDAVILTLYASSLTDDEVLEIAGREDYYAVTLPKARADAGLARRLDAEGITTFAHTVNNQLRATRLAYAGVHGVYTDRLTPARGRRDAAGSEDTWTIEALPAAPVDRADAAARSVLVMDLSDALDPRCGSLRVTRPDPGTGSVTLEVYTARAPAQDSLVGAPGGASTGMSGGTRRTVVEVIPGPDRIPLATLFPDALPAWIAAPEDVKLEVHWELLDRPALVRHSTSGPPSAWHAHGPQEDLGGIALFFVNPGKLSREVTLVLRRKGVLPNAKTLQIEPDALVVERVPFEGGSGDVDLTVNGGGVVVHLLRAGPECSVVR